MSEPNIKFPNVGGVSIKISNLNLYPRANTFQDETILFSNVTVEEDMFAESIFGSIEYTDTSKNLAYTNQISINDPVTIQFDGNVFEFQITDINIASDLASKQVIGPDSLPTKVVVRFASKLFLINNFTSTFTEDFIGKISIKENEETKTEYLPGVNIPNASSTVEDFKPLQGFVQTAIAPLLDKPLNADSTFNDVWLKHDPTSYPYSKIGSSLRISQIMNYICEYACDMQNKNAVNFFFWEDLESWNFRSIESLMRDQKDISNDNLPYFTPSTDENYAGAIVSMEIINAVIPNKLLNAGAFVSEYVRVKPDWSNPFHSYLDTAGNLSRTKVEYNYENDGEKWLKISQTPVRHFSGLSTTVRITDNVYGYYQNPYQQANAPWWNYYDNYNQYENDQSERVQPDRMESEFWQSQYDMCELPGDYLNIIMKKIKWDEDALRYRKEYADAKRLKQEWEVYKKSACCERELPETFFALITNAKKIYGSEGHSVVLPENTPVMPDSGGIYRYEWIEVEFWPREDVKKIPEPIRYEGGERADPSPYSVIQFEDNSFPFVFTAPVAYMKGIPPVDSSYPDTRAFNLNEILNSRIPTSYETTKPNGYTGPPYTLIMNPGITDTLGLTATDKTEKAAITSYPKNFKMMPVGRFRIIGPCGNATHYQAGRIVQMYRIPVETLTNIQTRLYPTPEFFPKRAFDRNMYIFDVENAHDGLCVDC